MKQCPKCSSTYASDKQKFCTKDGTPLVDAHQASAGQDATIRIDSTQLDDEITKVISQPLPRMTGSAFDPYKTQVSTQQESAAPPPAPSQPIAPPPVAAPPSTPTPSVSTPAPPPPSQPIAPPSAAPPPPSRLAQTISAPAPPESVPPQPTRPFTPSAEAAPPPPAPPPTTANIGSAQPTNASITTDTVPAVTVSPGPRMAASLAGPTPPVQAAKKRSKLPLILGILFVLFLIAVGVAVAGYFLFPVIKPMLTKRIAQVEPRRPEPTPMVVSTPEMDNPKPEAPKIEVPPYSPPANAVQFVNSNAKLDGKLSDHYVDFSFYYPNTWQKDPKAGVAGASNFAKVERRLPPDFTQENFAVGWYSSTGSAEGDRVIFPTLADNLSKQFAKAPAFSEYKKVSEGSTKVGVYDGYEFRFESASRNTEHGDIKIWGRVIFVPPTDGSNNGVTLLMLTTSLAPELRSVDDVGVKGQLPMVLESFRFGK